MNRQQFYVPVRRKLAVVAPLPLDVLENFTRTFFASRTNISDFENGQDPWTQASSPGGGLLPSQGISDDQPFIADSDIDCEPSGVFFCVCWMVCYDKLWPQSIVVTSLIPLGHVSAKPASTCCVQECPFPVGSAALHRPGRGPNPAITDRYPLFPSLRIAQPRFGVGRTRLQF